MAAPAPSLEVGAGCEHCEPARSSEADPPQERYEHDCLNPGPEDLPGRLAFRFHPILLCQLLAVHWQRPRFRSRPHDAQRSAVFAFSTPFAVPARTISHAAAVVEIATKDCARFRCSALPMRRWLQRR